MKKVLLALALLVSATGTVFASQTTEEKTTTTTEEKTVETEDQKEDQKK